MKNKLVWIDITYKIVAGILFALAVVYLPLPWWHKLLLWLGVGMLVNKHGH